MSFNTFTDKDKAEFLKLILDSTFEGFYSVDTHGRLTLCNAAFLQMLRYETADELLGQEIHPIIHHSYPDGTDYDVNDCPVYEAATTGKCQYISQDVFFRKDGTHFPAEYRAHPIVKEGILQGAICTLVDITKRRHSEEALRESERRTRLIIDSALDAILTTDSKGIVTEWNKQAEYIFGWRAQEIVGHEMSAMIIPEIHRNRHRAGMERFLKTGETSILNKRIEVEALHKDGHIFPIELAVTDQEYKGEIYFTAFARDISKRKQAQEQLIRARNDAETANIAKSEFLANMSHELRTPMNAVIGLSNILALTEPLTAKQKEFVKTLQLSANSLLALINDLLDISKIETQSIQLEQIPFDLAKTIDEITDMVSIEAKRKGLHLISEEPIGKKTVIGDPTRLRQVILNLCSNAVKFTEHGSIYVSVSFLPHEKPDTETVCITIKDTGIGIEPEQLSTIFDKFVQADSSINRKYGGTGLGLAISKNLAEIMGGAITVDSKPGEGTTLTVRIPMLVKN